MWFWSWSKFLSCEVTWVSPVYHGCQNKERHAAAPRTCGLTQFHELCCKVIYMTLVTSCFSILLTPFTIPVVDGDMFIWSLLAKLMLSSMYDAIAHRRCKMQDLVETCWAMLSPVETMCQKTWQRRKQSCCCKTGKIRFDEPESLRMIGVCKHLMLYVVEICWNSFYTFSAFFPLEGVQGRSSVLPDQIGSGNTWFSWREQNRTSMNKSHLASLATAAVVRTRCVPL